MANASVRFDLPYILAGQAQKEWFHNEALALIDAALHPASEGTLASPPASPALGQAWIVGADAMGDWAGKTGQLAVWTEGGWRFVAPVMGMSVWDKAAGVARRWTGEAWSGGELAGSALLVGGLQVVGARGPAIASPSGGTTIDAEVRAAVEAVIVALKSHGLID